MIACIEKLLSAKLRVHQASQLDQIQKLFLVREYLTMNSALAVAEWFKSLKNVLKSKINYFGATTFIEAVLQNYHIFAEADSLEILTRALR